MSITWSLRYPRIMTPCRAKISVAVIWLAASVLASLHLLGHLLHSDGNFFNYGRYYMLFLALVFVSSNVYMLLKSREQSKRIRQCNRGVITGLQRNIKEELKSVKTIAMVSATFVFGWLPLMVLSFLFGNRKEEVIIQRYFAFLSPFTALNIISDPLIYYIRGPEFRMFYQRWKRRRGLGTRISPSEGRRHESFRM